jgi:hypothetical protein
MGIRIINKEDYPMVLDWSNYERTTTKLRCKCQVCGCDVFRSINEIDTTKFCRCQSCGDKIGRINLIKPINKEDYPMVLDWSNFRIRRDKLPCKCDICGDVMYLCILEINQRKKCICVKCGRNNAKKRNLERYGVENVFQSEEIKEKIKITNLKKYNVENPSQSEEIKEKRKKTNFRNFGVEYFSQQNRELWQIEITSSKEKFEEYLKSFNKKVSSKELAKKLGFNDRSSILDYIIKYDLWNYIDSTSSYPEKELSEYINSLGFDTIKKRLKSCGEIDIFIPKLNIGIEYNGVYWHSDIRKDKNYHYNKTTCCYNEGIRLIHIFDYEWINNQDKIKSYIKAQLGLCEKRIFARKCEIREIDFKTAKPLLEYHQQKITTAQHYIGLYHENELVLVMLFGRIPKGIFTKNPIAEWEIKREICKEGYSVVGGKSKVFKYFVRNYNPQSVVSYVDRAKFTGKSYQIMGFKLDHINGARYDWVHRGDKTFKKRQPKIYKKMMELYKEGKVYRIYDAGRFCYLWKKSF